MSGKRKTNMPSQTNSVKRFQILSLDGGGIKALFSAAVLAAIEDDLQVRIADHFDLIAGTSAGGIISLGLGLGMRPKDIVKFYLEEGPNIFDKSFGLRSVQHWFYRKYSSRPLEEALKKCFGTKLLGDSEKRLVIPSFNIDENDVYIFRTAHDKRLVRDYKVPAWKVATATSAAPTFFPSFRDINHLRLIDGGVWANNPLMVAIIEAYGTLKIALENISAFSIGTSETIIQNRQSLNNGGILNWAIDNAALETILRGQSIAAYNHASFLLGDKNILRLNPQVAKGDLSLDGVSKADELIARASYHSRLISPQLQNDFLHHKAKRFVPFYKEN